MKKENQSLPQWLKRIDEGDLSDWMGWSADWDLDDLFKVVQPMSEARQQVLNAKSYLQYEFQLAHQSQPLQVLADSLGHVCRLRLEDAALTQSAEELSLRWGPPATKNELPMDHRFAPAQLWVFPQRGVSLYVLAPHQRGPLSLSAIALYTPTTLDDYLHQLEGDERVRMWED